MKQDRERSVQEDQKKKHDRARDDDDDHVDKNERTDVLVERRRYSMPWGCVCICVCEQGMTYGDPLEQPGSTSTKRKRSEMCATGITVSDEAVQAAVFETCPSPAPAFDGADNLVQLVEKVCVTCP